MNQTSDYKSYERSTKHPSGAKKNCKNVSKKTPKKTLQTAELPVRFYYNSDIQSNKIIQPNPSPAHNRLNKHTRFFFVCEKNVKILITLLRNHRKKLKTTVT